MAQVTLIYNRLRNAFQENLSSQSTSSASSSNSTSQSANDYNSETKTLRNAIPENFSSQSTSSASSSNDTSQPTNNDYNSEMNRLLSYPDNVSYKVASSLAKIGFYFMSENLIRCQFCGDTKHGVEIVQHSCNCSNNVPIPNDVSNYRYEMNRIISFLTVGWNKTVQPQSKYCVGALELARSGFFYTGIGDAARCVYCRLEVRGWEQGDTADGEHRRWNSSCLFLCERSVGNIKLGEENYQSSVTEDAVRMAVPMNSDQMMDKESLGIHKFHNARHSEYCSHTSRLASYNLWPLSLKQRPEHLSEAGFFYTGKGDRVICFQCGGGLKDWGSQDEPWTEHAIWFPRCQYLNAKMTQDFINKVAKLKNQQLNGDFSMSMDIDYDSFRQSATIPSVPTPAVTTADPSCAKQSPSGEEVPSHRQCKVCMDKELGIVFLPCGHMAACVDCAPQLKCCPVCRGELTAYVRAFLP